MRQANVNAVRVHAHVEPEALYDACDRAGIMVWQDMPLQWGYADSPEVERAAVATAREIVRYVGSHPSVFAWCAHNESPWSVPRFKTKYPDHAPTQNKRLDDRITAALKAADPSRYVHLNSGDDEHLYYGWYRGDWTDFARPVNVPLVSEFGAQALPDRSTLLTFMPLWAIWPTTDLAWGQWSYRNFQREIGLAKAPQGMNLDSWIRASQDYQAKVIRFAADRLRLQKYNPVSGIFQFQFVDPWPSVGWGVLDHLRRPKAGFAAMTMAYGPVHPVIVNAVDHLPANRDQDLVVAVVSDLADPVPGASVTLRVEPAQSGGGTRFWGVETPPAGAQTPPTNARTESGPALQTTLARIRLPADAVARPISLRIAPLPEGTYDLQLTVRDSRGRAIGFGGATVQVGPGL